MVAGRFNYHKILFSLETFSSAEEKLSYLYGVKVEVTKVIQCFTHNKFQPLRNYAKKNIFAEDGCDELTEYLQQVIGYYNSPLYSSRFISEEILKRHLREEVIKYKKFARMIDSEISYYVEQRDSLKNINVVANKSREIKMEDYNNTNENFEDNELNRNDNSTSIRELLNKQKKIVWKGSKEELIYFFDQLYSQQLLKIKSYDEIFSILSHYFISESGESMFVEKSASAKMNLNGPKLPEGYQRYMKSLEKLKSKE